MVMVHSNSRHYQLPEGVYLFYNPQINFHITQKNARKKASVDLMANACDRRKQVTVGLFHSW